MIMLRHSQRAVMMAALLLSLTGCGDGGIHEIREWMNEVKRTTKVSIEPVSEPKTFQPFVYEAHDAIDPFSVAKLEVAFAKAKAAARSGSGVRAPDMDRRREALESYPLDTIHLVGALQKRGMNFAVIKVDGNIFHAKVGNYIGTNFGMITNITETEVNIKEVIQDASGEWVEREAKLELQEAQK